MYRVNFTVLYPDGTLIEAPGRVLFNDLTMAAARLSQMADNLDIMVNAGSTSRTQPLLSGLWKLWITSE